MAIFEPAFNLTMKAEGGYANDPLDAGGETYKGVARKYNAGWSGWVAIDGVKKTKPASLNAALAADANLQQAIRHFYQVNYWDVNRTGDIHDQQLANQVFDTAVNCGTGSAARFLQEAAGVTVDGQVGQKALPLLTRPNLLIFTTNF
jgi:lysozyme family protein